MFSYNRKNLIYVLIFLIPFFLFLSRTKFFVSFKFKIIDVFDLPVRIVSFPLQEFKKMLFYHRTFEEYKRKTQEVNLLKSRLVGLEEVIKENTRLEKLLEFKRRLIYSSIAANVIGRDPSRWNSSIILDKGILEGVAVGQPVVSELGVVGKIAEVSESKAKIITVTDPQFSAAIMVQRSRESGVLSGTLQGICRLKFINDDADIIVGDQIITSKLSSAFPDSLMIGEVVEIKSGINNNTKECLVKPTVAFSQLEEVLIILK